MFLTKYFFPCLRFLLRRKKKQHIAALFIVECSIGMPRLFLLLFFYCFVAAQPTVWEYFAIFFLIFFSPCSSWFAPFCLCTFASSRSLPFSICLFFSLSRLPQGFTLTRTRRKGRRTAWPARRSPKIWFSTKIHCWAKWWNTYRRPTRWRGRAWRPPTNRAATARSTCPALAVSKNAPDLISRKHSKVQPLTVGAVTVPHLFRPIPWLSIHRLLLLFGILIFIIPSRTWRGKMGQPRMLYNVTPLTILCVSVLFSIRIGAERWCAVDRSWRDLAKLDRIPLEVARLDGYVVCAGLASFRSRSFKFIYLEEEVERRKEKRKMNKKSWLLPPLLLYLLSLVYHTMLFHSTLGLHGWLFHHFFFCASLLRRRLHL